MNDLVHYFNKNQILNAYVYYYVYYYVYLIHNQNLNLNLNQNKIMNMNQNQINVMNEKINNWIKKNDFEMKIENLNVDVSVYYYYDDGQITIAFIIND